MARNLDPATVNEHRDIAFLGNLVFDYRWSHLPGDCPGHLVQTIAGPDAKTAEVFAQAPVVGDLIEVKKLATRSVGKKPVNIKDGAVALAKAINQAQHHLNVGSTSLPRLETESILQHIQDQDVAPSEKGKRNLRWMKFDRQ